MTGFCDSFQRPISYLRISVTDRCNLRCLYCFPQHSVSHLPRREVLSFEEIIRVVQACAQLGIDRIRLTGGEPLVRENLPELIFQLSRIEGIKEVSLTTNGVLLGRYAPQLKEMGLKRVNVSLDSLRPERFYQITGMDRLEQVLQGMEKAQEMGLNPVKINMVVLRGRNDDEVLDFARWTIQGDWHVRFIELMPFGEGDASLYVPMQDVVAQLKALGELIPCYPVAGGGPAKYFRFPQARGTVGFISPISQHFCFSCNRLRLSAAGKLRLCLMGDAEVDLKPLLRSGAGLEEVKGFIQRAVAQKPWRHRLAQGILPQERVMARVGG